MPPLGDNAEILQLFETDQHGRIWVGGSFRTVAVLWSWEGSYFATTALVEKSLPHVHLKGPTVRVDGYKSAHREELIERLTVMLMFWDKWEVSP